MAKIVHEMRAHCWWPKRGEGRERRGKGKDQESRGGEIGGDARRQELFVRDSASETGRVVGKQSQFSRRGASFRRREMPRQRGE